MTEPTSNGLSWSSLNLNEIETAPQTERSEVPPGTYKFRLVGAKPSPFENQVGSTDIDFVVTEGPYSKRHVFASLPMPDKGKWVVSAAALLIKQLGGTHNSGEDLIDTLNRIASSGANPIQATLSENTYTDRNTGELKTGRPKFQYFSVQAAL
jgi:hypothetical protein